MTDLEIIEWIKNDMLKSGLPSQFVNNVVFLSYDDDDMYRLLCDWMKQNDEVERKLVQEQMTKILDKHNRMY